MAVTMLLLGSPSLGLAGVRSVFDLDNPDGGPFPSDRFTVTDDRNITGLRVALPLPDCTARPTDCDDLRVVNTLDGFNVTPRISIPFDAPIDLSTVNSRTVFFVRLGNTRHDDDRGHSARIGINQVVWDPEGNVLHAKSDQLLDQHTRYLLIATSGLRDVFGAPVQPADAFRAFLGESRDRNDGYGRGREDRSVTAYRRAIRAALRAAGISPKHVVAASVFTTLSVTAFLEKVRDQIKATPTEPADFLIGPGGSPALFDVASLRNLVLRRQVGTNPVLFSNLQLFGNVSPNVGTLAYGKFRSPNYLLPEVFIPEIGTRTVTPIPQGTNEIYFTLQLPLGQPPPGGWPVVIYGHGGGVTKDDFPLVFAGTMAANGIATISINAVGHGGGPLGTLDVTTANGTTSIPAGGRGIDQGKVGFIGPQEGFSTLFRSPQQIIGARDGIRQTVVDLMQLVHVIQAGMPNIDASRIYYFGISLGGMYGIPFLAVEPYVRFGVPNVAAASLDGVGAPRLLPDSRAGVGITLANRAPSLVNPPGLTAIDDVPVGRPYFDENIPVRDMPPLVNTVSGAMEIQKIFDWSEWVSQSGDPVAYAPYLRREPLPGVPAKSIIFQFAKGDLSVANPTSSALIRAGDLADVSTFFRNDLAFADHLGGVDLPRDPHRFVLQVGGSGIPAIAIPAQQQIATFFATEGHIIAPPGAERYFEVPVVLPLPEDLAFIPPIHPVPVFSEFPIVPTYPRQNTSPVAIVTGPDGNLWFAEFAGNQIGRITLDGLIIEFAIPTPNSQPSGITVGPDRNLWFTEQNGNQIGRITPDGGITEFAVPTPGSGPTLITAGPDGNLWFTELTGNKIARITTAGVVTEFPVPTPGSGPNGITTGPDGNLWFTERDRSQIGRITPEGAVTEFVIPTPFSGPRGITAGPDGNVWFVESNSNRIGRITPGGVITEVLAFTGNFPRQITAGADGNLWFTAFNSNLIGRITTAGGGGFGGIWFVPTPSSGPLGITTGPDGNIWFTEANVNRIGQITIVP
jgi:streptogramin lyase